MTTLTTLPEKYAAILEEARTVGRDLEPLAVAADASNELDSSVLDVLRSSGLTGYTVPAEYGGKLATVDPFAVCLIREGLMSVSSHADSLFALQGIGSFAITTGGTEEQKATWLPRVATGEVLAALALTEPLAGSDLKSITTTITHRNGDLILNGTKSFISNAGVAGFYTVLARDADDASGALSAILVPADTDGVAVEPGIELIAPHVLGDVHFENVVLPASALLGQPGNGLSLVLATLAVFRISVAGAAVGLAQTALDEAVRHARTREQFGRPLARLGPVAALLADSWVDVASTRLLTYQVAEMARLDPLANLEHSSLAKLGATEACSRVVDRCVQVMGRWGLVHESRIERCYRQSRPMRVYEGASEVLRLGIARRLTDSTI